MARQSQSSDWAYPLFDWRPAFIPRSPDARASTALVGRSVRRNQQPTRRPTVGPVRPMLPRSSGPPRPGRPPSSEPSSSDRLQGALTGALIYAASQSADGGPLLLSDCHRVHPGNPYACSQGRDVPRPHSEMLIGLPVAALRGWLGQKSRVERLWEAAPPPRSGIP
jgi:hypothetical protein